VPASRVGSNGKVSHYNIPDMRSEEWLPTRPASHTRAVNNAATLNGPGFRKVIKMIKAWNHRLGRPMRSYHIEVIALRTDSDWDDLSWPVFQWFDTAHDLTGEYLWHGIGFADDYLDYESRPKLLALLDDTRLTACDGWSATFNGRDDHQKAITAFRKIFGQRFPAYGT
jgi:hypothetical protein